MKHLNIEVYGLVQGVFFRIRAKEEAARLNVKGFAKNMPDGSVYIEAEGEKENLDEFVKWCTRGPSPAKVEKVSITEGIFKKFEEFKIA